MTHDEYSYGVEAIDAELRRIEREMAVIDDALGKMRSQIEKRGNRLYWTEHLYLLCLVATIALAIYSTLTSPDIPAWIIVTTTIFMITIIIVGLVYKAWEKKQGKTSPISTNIASTWLFVPDPIYDIHDEYFKLVAARTSVLARSHRARRQEHTGVSPEQLDDADRKLIEHYRSGEQLPQIELANIVGLARTRIYERRRKLADLGYFMDLPEQRRTRSEQKPNSTPPE